MTAAPKPPMTIRQRKALKSKPRPVNRKAAEDTFTRDGWTCRWCGRPGGALDPHHRLRRSQGGKDDVRTLISVHRTCHREIHEGQIIEARRRRFLVSRDEELDLAVLS